jgi:amidase
MQALAKFLAVASLLFATLARGATFDLQTATLADINAAMDAGALSSEKLVGLYLARIAAYDQAGPRINSDHHAERESARDRPRPRRRAQGQGPALPAPRRPGRA